jgi:hypothetical protein
MCFVTNQCSTDGQYSTKGCIVDRLARELLIEALSMGKSTVPKHAKNRSLSGLCLIPGCECKQLVRGLCLRHKNAFYYELSHKLTKREKLDFERENIRKGLVLPSGDQQSIRREESSPFSSCG